MIESATLQLKSLIERLPPNMISSKEIIQAYFWVYTGLRFPDRNLALCNVFKVLREAGCSYSATYEILVVIYRELGRSVQELFILRSMLPTHVALMNPNGDTPAGFRVSWAVLRSSDPVRHYELAEPQTAVRPRLRTDNGTNVTPPDPLGTEDFSAE